jgi:RNase P/RNase MRP subunit p29
VKFFPAASLALLLSSCGYHIAGHSDLLPQTIKTIAIPAFANGTTRYKLTDRLPEAISREFLTRTRYKVVSDVNQADAVLRGTVINYSAYSTIFDPVKGRATAVELHVTMQVSLTDRATGKVLFSRPSFEVREQYEISVDPSQYFEESDAALDRVSQQVARQVVSAVLENF